MIIDNLYIRLSHLVPEPNCDTSGDNYNNIVWRDVRPKPSTAQLIGVDLALITARQLKLHELNQVVGSDRVQNINCNVNGTVYEMAFDGDRARMLLLDCMISERLGETAINVVDFHGVEHIDVPLSDAFEIAITQNSKISKRVRTIEKITARINAATLEQLDQITFP